VARARTVLAVLMLAGASQPANAAITISTGATQNVTCSAGICAPTASRAVLNAGDLENLLASGSVEVTTTGTLAEAEDLNVKAAIAWPDASSLTLVARGSISIDGPVTVEGSGGLALDYGAKGTLDFGGTGSVTFAGLSSGLAVNGTVYTLVNSISSLASAIAGSPSGAFALANDYDASQDGTYPGAPVQTVFAGSFEGLGHRISNLTIDDQNVDAVGLFVELDNATLRDVALVDANMTAEGGGDLGAVAADACGGSLINVQSVHGTLYGGEGEAGGSIVGGLLAGLGDDYACHGGTILRSSASGSVVDAGPEGSAGGLVGEIDAGTIGFSHSSASVSAPYGGAGGLVGVMYSFTGTSGIDQSFATGRVSADGGGRAGGIVGDNTATIENCYATGAVSVASGGDAGGLAGTSEHAYNAAPAITTSWSMGRVKRVSGAVRGGFIGGDYDPGDLTDDYWDLDTSGVGKKSEGAGSPKNDTGIAGLTTRQLQSGLPPGFDPKIWAEDPNINSGLPYLVANPPPK